MKNTTLAFLCCSAFLAACDNSSDATDSVVDDVKEKASGAMDAAKEAATDALASGKDLKETAIESAGAAVDSVKEMSSTAVDKTSAVIAGDDGNKGETIYNKHCVACHGTGVAGSPKLDDKAAWSARITQGNDVLSQHAIKGYKGETGYMPPKGGFTALSDEEISQTVMYMVSQVQ